MRKYNLPNGNLIMKRKYLILHPLHENCKSI
nr:MAG TPA: hypothetical protein [Caudoviricetes sp.]